MKVFAGAALFLAALNGFAQAPDREVHAQVMNVAGQPVTNAMVQVHAVTREGGTRYGANDDVESSAKTDARGEFVIRGKNPFRAATLTVEAPGLARGVFSEVPTGPGIQPLKMVEGAAVFGALVKEGQPVAGVKVRVSNVERNSKIYTTDLDATTDDKGRFRISNLPPRQDYFIYGLMESLADQGALSSRRITAGADGSALDLGELNLEPGYIIEGRILGAPASGEITLARERGRDQQTTRSDANGHFRFTGAPAEIVSLSMSPPGHRLSLRNGSIDPSDTSRMIGRLTTNKTDLVIEFEPGENLDPLNISRAAVANEPLRGAEPPSAGLDTIAVTGAVVEAESGEKITAFISSEGRVNRNSYDWFFTRTQRHTNGVFATHLTRGELPPVLVIQSDDHIPWVSPPIKGATNFSIALKRGVHPKGVVLKPDGSAAPRVTVYLADRHSNTRITELGVNNNALKTITDAGGRFSFLPQNDAVSLLVFDREAGFAETSIDELLRTGEIRLKNFAKVEGRLLIGDRPGTNEAVFLTTAPAPYQWYPRETPAFSMNFATKTDQNGRFLFNSVPPSMVEVAHSPMLKKFAGDDSTLSMSLAIGVMPVTQTRRILAEAGKTERVDLGGEGRDVVGKVEVAGFEDSMDSINWRGSINVMENVVPHEGPSDAALKSLFVKLTTAAGDKSAEKAYQDERASFAAASRKYFATEKGLAALLASRRYFMQFADDGNFRVQDVPPGKYLITLRLVSSDPAKLNTRGWVIADLQTEITVPEGTASFDLGTLKVSPGARK